jgi:hypothetical protein
MRSEAPVVCYGIHDSALLWLVWRVFSWATWELIKGELRAADLKIAGLCRNWRTKMCNFGYVSQKRNLGGGVADTPRIFFLLKKIFFWLLS